MQTKINELILDYFDEGRSPRGILKALYSNPDHYRYLGTQESTIRLIEDILSKEDEAELTA